MVWTWHLPLIVLGLLTFAVPETSAEKQQRPARQGSPGGDVFSRWDNNRDGKLTRDELPERMRRAFDRVDANGDGFITAEEDAAFRNRRRPGVGNRPGPSRQSQIPDAIQAELDIPYAGTDDPRQRLDLYLPKNPNSDQPLPVVVWIHGGAWRAGNKRSGGGMLRPLVRTGDYAGVSVGYRLTGQSIWPAQIHDCKAAIRWIRANAQKYHLDPDRIGVWGSSAGGHLVAMLGTGGSVKDLEGDLGKHTDQQSRVTCVVDYFGPSDLLTMGKYPSRMQHDAPDSPESILVGGALQETKEAARNASPTTCVSKDDPPFMIVHGDEDPLVPYNQSEQLNALLRKAGVDVTFITIRGGGHGGFRSEELLRRVHLFFDAHLRSRDAKISADPISQGQDGRLPR